MGVRGFNPVTPSRRAMTVSDFEEITKSKPEKSLTTGQKNKAGRNSAGRVSVRWRGGGHKRRYRAIDFKRNKFGIPASVVGIEYDPNRSARIALLAYADGEKRYILAPAGLEVGQQVFSGSGSDIKPGNAIPLAEIPLGTQIHNIELKKGKGGQMARSAGCYGQLQAKETPYAHIKLSSGEIRLVRLECMATIGHVGNESHEKINVGKAGRSRWLRKMPKVRGVAMNPVDHPHGGGEGKTSGGRHPVTPWGVPTKGYRTRKNKTSDRFIVRRRHAS